MLSKTIVVGPFQCNCRLIVCERTGEGALIDPGDELQRILQVIERSSTSGGAPIRIKYLFHTHGHLDHIAATRGVKERLSAQGGTGASSGNESPKILLHQADEGLYQSLSMQAEMFGLRYPAPLPLDGYLEDGQEFSVGDLKLTVLHTPGHSPGSICFRLHENKSAVVPETLFSGDTLFQGSVGRTDLWGGDQEQLFRSIRERILVLDDDTHVCPGHGLETRVGIEKRENPFL